MALEIERKFLVNEGAWRNEKGTKYRQGYLNSTKERTVRVRTIDNKGYLTIKGISRGAVRVEYEYEIPAAEAEAMLDDLCEKPLIDKKRYKIEYNKGPQTTYALRPFSIWEVGSLKSYANPECQVCNPIAHLGKCCKLLLEIVSCTYKTGEHKTT